MLFDLFDLISGATSLLDESSSKREPIVTFDSYGEVLLQCFITSFVFMWAGFRFAGTGIPWQQAPLLAEVISGLALIALIFGFYRSLRANQWRFHLVIFLWFFKHFLVLLKLPDIFKLVVNFVWEKLHGEKPFELSSFMVLEPKACALKSIVFAPERSTEPLLK